MADNKKLLRERDHYLVLEERMDLVRQQYENSDFVCFYHKIEMDPRPNIRRIVVFKTEDVLSHPERLQNTILHYPGLTKL